MTERELYIAWATGGDVTTNYKRGADFERKIVNWWRSLEGHFAMRSAGSHTPIDVIAWNDETVWLIQARVDRQSPAELAAALQALRDVPFPLLHRSGFAGNQPPYPAVSFGVSPRREAWIKSPVRGEDWTRYEA